MTLASSLMLFTYQATSYFYTKEHWTKYQMSLRTRFLTKIYVAVPMKSPDSIIREMSKQPLQTHDQPSA